MIDFELIKSNWQTFESLCTKQLTSSGIGDLLEALGERICTCPASTKKDQYGSYAGGMVEHALETTVMMRTLNKSLDMKIPVSSILKVGLLHDLGKIGDLEKEYFVEQNSDWHREKLGQLYKFNEDLDKMSISHRTLYLLQHFNIGLTCDEWLAIQLAQGSHFEENRFYVGHEPSLALLLQHAKSLVVHKRRL